MRTIFALTVFLLIFSPGQSGIASAQGEDLVLVQGNPPLSFILRAEERMERY